MGFVTGSIRLLYLTQLKNDLEHKIMLITEAKLDMSKSITDLLSVGTDLDPDSPIIKDMKARRDKLKIIVDELDAKITMYQNKLTAVNNEIGAAQGMINNDVKREFSYGMGVG